MLKVWMSKWRVSLRLTELGQSAVRELSSAVAVRRPLAPVPDWQVPAYLRQRHSGDRVRT